MGALVADWGAEIILALIIAGLTGWFKFKEKRAEKKLEEYERAMQESQDNKTRQMIEDELQTVLNDLWAELEDIRKKVIDLQAKHENDVHILDEDMKLIIASYKYRLVQLCRELLNQGFMYQYQYEHLNEFFTLYTSLGGNGQAKRMYDRVTEDLEIKPNPDNLHS